MNTFIPFAIFSAELAGESQKLNEARHAFLVRQLDNSGQAIDDSLQGCYKGSRERSVLVLLPLGEDSWQFTQVMNLAKAFQQESVLFVDANRAASLHYTDGRVEFIGQWTAITADDSLWFDSYTEAHGSHYAVCNHG